MYSSLNFNYFSASQFTLILVLVQFNCVYIYMNEKTKMFAHCY